MSSIAFTSGRIGVCVQDISTVVVVMVIVTLVAEKGHIVHWHVLVDSVGAST